MKVAIYGRLFSQGFADSMHSLYNKLVVAGAEIIFFQPFLDYCHKEGLKFKPGGVFHKHHELDDSIDYILSIGGDGTFLEAVTYVRDLNIPIVGVNAGRLGFLADIGQDDIADALDTIMKGDFTIEKRDLLHVEGNTRLLGDFPCALNEVTIMKSSDSSMLTIHTYINDEFLNSYWADGLIFATPTGSTAYSLSVGGPIVIPNSDSLILSPIAPHSLTVRPLVVPNNSEIKFNVEVRQGSYLLSIDSRSVVINKNIDFRVRKAGFSVRVVKLPNQNFYGTLRNKLMWGLDRRNY